MLSFYLYKTYRTQNYSLLIPAQKRAPIKLLTSVVVATEVGVDVNHLCIISHPLWLRRRTKESIQFNNKYYE